jgi:hypothetical protein
MQLVGEAALLSLTVGLTGGTIGVDLGGAARVAAFIQILLTLLGGATFVGWAWSSLVRQLGRGSRSSAAEGSGTTIGTGGDEQS